MNDWSFKALQPRAAEGRKCAAKQKQICSAKHDRSTVPSRRTVRAFFFEKFCGLVLRKSQKVRGVRKLSASPEQIQFYPNTAQQVTI
ncbi:hypothetical protein DSM14862_00984 [Sulfitobacter indolifex]|nr:hypothetical protein DSM14862_00984 [Sulfitobacter indolifex]